MADHPAILSAHDVRKSFLSGDRQIEVLRGVDLAVSAGESVSICGESGSGKSTLLNLLAGLDKPDAGEIRWAGSPDTGADRRATYLGMVFQSFYLIPELDARANVLMARRICGRPDAEARARADELLARVGLAERRHHLPGQLSGGERQRVAVARALMNRPQLILADEPTGNLDSHTAGEIISLLEGLNRKSGQTLIVVTHDPTVGGAARRMLTLRDGRIDLSCRG